MIKNFSIIAAVAKNNVIGCNKTNDLLWKISADLKHFKQQTIGKTIIMGSNTFRSLKNPLPNRRNVVISRRLQFIGAETYSSLEEALEREDGELIVIGGGELYQHAIEFGPKKFDITIVDLTPNGNVTFPIDIKNFEQESFSLYSDYFNKNITYNKLFASDWQIENDIKFKFTEYDSN